MYKRPRVEPGNWCVVDDRSGFRLLNTQMQFQWNNLLVWEKVWEARQPLDYLRGIPDDMSVPYSRPKQQPSFLTENQVQASDL